ncbi:hypothetical protein M0811_11387 [Anaeramoeba ignava]|uniref:Uncharacterized protein n=1 Tax=Anaeramoeba ignava TaxID=1746090 RepID=A0A9Q0LBV9_ANAIG|nr:hypothetical protein M0811_11387 [Anaeramoeba ignava]
MSFSIKSASVYQIYQLLEFLDLFKSEKEKEKQKQIQKNKLILKEIKKQFSRRYRKKFKLEYERQFKRQEKEMEKEINEKEIVFWNVFKANKFEMDFINSSFNTIQQTLSQINPQIQIIFNENEKVLNIQKMNGNNSSYINIKEYNELISILENQINKKGLFDYMSLAKDFLDEIKKYCLKKFPFISKEEIEPIYIKENVGFQEEWSVHFDLSFDSGDDYGNCISCPNPNNFNKRLLDECYDSRLIGYGRVYVDYFQSIFTSIPHEFVHCIQSKKKQLDYSSLSWITEHDASILGTSFFYHIVKNMDQKTFHKFFPIEGLIELFVLHEFNHTIELKEKYSNEYIQKLYLNWIDDFGLNYPEEDDPNINEETSNYMKQRVSIEGFFYSEDLFNTCFDYCLKIELEI